MDVFTTPPPAGTANQGTAMPPADQPALPTSRLARNLLWIPSGVAAAVVCGTVWTMASDPAGRVAPVDNPVPAAASSTPTAVPSLSLVPAAPPQVLASNARRATPSTARTSARATWAAATATPPKPAPPTAAAEQTRAPAGDSQQGQQGDQNGQGQDQGGKPGKVTIVQEFGGYALQLVKTVAAPVTGLLGG